MIRNEKCSEKIDVWSFGVVLWELLTCEIPYRGVESSRIIIGIGYNQLKLHLPSSCPDGLKLLMTMCWSLQPTNRPSFKQILLHLQIYCSEFMQRMNVDQFNAMKARWRAEIQESLASMKSKTTYSSSVSDDEDGYNLVEKRKQELEHARDIRELYEKKLNQVNDLYDEMNGLLIKLKEREAELKRLQQEKTKF